MSKYLGRAFVRANGLTIASLPGSAKLNPGGVERSAVVGDFGMLGYTEKPVHAEVECDIAVGADTDLSALQNMVDGTVTFEGDTGQVWIVRKACLGKGCGSGYGLCVLPSNRSCAPSANLKARWLAACECRETLYPC